RLGDAWKVIASRIPRIARAAPPLRSSYGLHAPYALRTIIEIESDDHIVGISETYGGDEPVRQLETVRKQIIGADPFRLMGFLSPMVEGQGSGDARSQLYHVPGTNPLDA